MAFYQCPVILTKKEGVTAVCAYGQDAAKTLELFPECGHVSRLASDTDQLHGRHLRQNTTSL